MQGEGKEDGKEWWLININVLQRMVSNSSASTRLGVKKRDRTEVAK